MTVAEDRKTTHLVEGQKRGVPTEVGVVSRSQAGIGQQNLLLDIWLTVKVSCMKAIEYEVVYWKRVMLTDPSTYAPSVHEDARVPCLPGH